MYCTDCHSFDKRYLKPTVIFLYISFNFYPAGTESITPTYATFIEPDQPAHPYSLARLYTVGWPTSSSDLDIPKMMMYSSKRNSEG